jgi:hypothetical protein
MITVYKISEIEDYEEFINNLFNGLRHYQKSNKEFIFKLTYSKDTIELKTTQLEHGQLN